MEKLVSVIVPCYNVARWLPQCFLSLVKQSIGIDKIELIFVDDASTDGGATWGLLEEMERAFPNSVIVIRLEKNVRQGGARNVGLRYAKGKYLAFVDADDFVSEDFLEKVYKIAVEKDADIVQFGYFLYKSKEVSLKVNKEKADFFLEIETEEERKKMLVGEHLSYGCWNKLYRREMLERAGTFFAEGVIYEEPLFVYPLLFYVKNVVFLKDSFYYYRQNNEGTMRSVMEEKKTIFDHATVQKAVFDCLKGTEFFTSFYEEIKLYFLHTYLYETLLFAKGRKMEISFEEFLPLAEVAKREIPDIADSVYMELIPKQMKLYREIEKDLERREYEEYREGLGEL